MIKFYMIPDKTKNRRDLNKSDIGKRLLVSQKLFGKNVEVCEVRVESISPTGTAILLDWIKEEKREWSLIGAYEVIDVLD